MTIKLGMTVKDRITGFEGDATGRCEYINGKVQFHVEPKWQRDAMPIDGRWIDETRLEQIPPAITLAPPAIGT